MVFSRLGKREETGVTQRRERTWVSHAVMSPGGGGREGTRHMHGVHLPAVGERRRGPGGRRNRDFELDRLCEGRQKEGSSQKSRDQSTS